MKLLATGYRPGMDLRSVVGQCCAAGLLLGLLVGCGSGTETITKANADTLRSQVDAIRTAVADGRNPAALSALADLRKQIRRLAESGELNADDSEVLLTQADRIAEDIKSRATPTPTPRPTPTPLVVVELPLGPGKGEGKGKEKDKGKEKGDGEDEGDD